MYFSSLVECKRFRLSRRVTLVRYWLCCFYSPSGRGSSSDLVSDSMLLTPELDLGSIGSSLSKKEFLSFALKWSRTGAGPAGIFSVWGEIMKSIGLYCSASREPEDWTREMAAWLTAWEAG